MRLGRFKLLFWRKAVYYLKVRRREFFEKPTWGTQAQESSNAEKASHEKVAREKRRRIRLY